MDNGVDQPTDSGNIVESPSGDKSFSGVVENRDPLVSNPPAQKPDGVPDKFWDAANGTVRYDDLMKSYTELEKRLGAGNAASNDGDGDADDNADGETDGDADDPNADADNGEGEGDADGDADGDEDNGEDGEEGDKDQDDVQAPLVSAIEAAQAAYAETGELTAEHRKPLLDAGISDQQIDLYLAGVKAVENALKSAAVSVAGDEDTLAEAIAWAGANWTPKQIAAYDAQVGDVETVKGAVTSLMADYRAANPGEGKLTNINSGANHGDVYTDIEDFRKDLAAADQAGDRLGRKKALDKARRSQRAGLIKMGGGKQLF